MRGVATLLGLALLTAPAPAHSEDRSPDARIRYYRARLGGRSTYPAWARLGLAYADKARLTGATRYYLDAARFLERSLAMQRNYEALLGLAGVALALHRFPEARAHAREAVETSPADPAAVGALFDAELGLGDAEAAAKTLEGMPAESFARLVRLAALREYRGDGSGALADVERACALGEAAAGPAVTRAWCGVRIGALRLAACDPAAARAQYLRATSIVPGYYLAREHLAELDAAEGRAREAAAGFRELLARLGEPRYRLQLAALHESAGRPREADGERGTAHAELHRRAAEDVRDAWHELAMLEADDPAATADALRWAEKDWRNRQDVHAADALAWAALRRGDTARATDAMERALGPGGASPTILLHAAALRMRTGRAAEARALVDRALACPASLTPVEHALAGRVRRELAPGGSPR